MVWTTLGVTTLCWKRKTSLDTATEGHPLIKQVRRFSLQWMAVQHYSLQERKTRSKHTPCRTPLGHILPRIQQLRRRPRWSNERTKSLPYWHPPWGANVPGSKLAHCWSIKCWIGSHTPEVFVQFVRFHKVWYKLLFILNFYGLLSLCIFGLRYL